MRGRYRYTSLSEIEDHGSSYEFTSLAEESRKIFDVLHATCPFKLENEGSPSKPPCPNHIPNHFPSPPFHRENFGKLIIALNALTRGKDVETLMLRIGHELDAMLEGAQQTLSVFYSTELADAIAKVRERFVNLKSASTDDYMSLAYQTLIVNRLDSLLQPIDGTVTSVITGPLWSLAENEVASEWKFAVHSALTDLEATALLDEAIGEFFLVLDEPSGER